MRSRTLSLAASICLVLVLAATAFMAACTKPAPVPSPAPTPAPAPKPAPPAPAPKEEITVTIAGRPAAWASRIMDSLIADTIGRETPYNTKIYGGIGLAVEERYAPLMDGKFDISIDISGYTALLLNIKETSPDLAKRFEYLMLFPHVFRPYPLIVHADLDVKSLRDAIDRKLPLRIAAGRGGSYQAVNLMWQALGVPNGIDAVEQWGGTVETSTTSSRLGGPLREGVVNALFNTGDVYRPYIDAVHAVRPLKVVPTALDEKDLQAIKEVFLEADRYVMRAGDYTCVTEDTPLIGLVKGIIASPKLSEEVAYNVVKAIWEQRELLARGFIEFEYGLQPEVVSLAKELGIPFHPGSERFFKEIGIW